MPDYTLQFLDLHSLLKRLKYLDTNKICLFFFSHSDNYSLSDKNIK